MPITLKKINAQVKDPTTGEMIPAGILSSDSITTIAAAENSAITRINNKKTEAINQITQMEETIPSDYADFAAEAAYKDMIAQTQAAMTATKTYTTGEYICVNKKLYKTTTAITSGLALVVGTNIEEVKLSESVSASAAQIATNTSDIGDLKESLKIEQNGAFILSETISGSYNSTGAVVTNPNRIRNVGFLQVSKGQAIHFVPGTTTAQVLYGTFTMEKVFVSDSPWITAETTITIPNDGYIIIVFAKADKTTAITPADFDATFEIYTKWKASDFENAESIENTKESLNSMLPVLSGTNLFTKSLGSMPSAPITRNGVTITFIQPNAIVINGTATASFNIDLMSKSFLVPSPTTLHHKIITSSDLKHSYWTPGYFKQDNTPSQYKAIVRVNVVVDYNYPADAYYFRDYFHIESGDVFDNDAYMFIVTDREVDDLGGQVDDLGEQVDDLGEQISLLITGKTWEVSETKTSSGYVVLTYNPPIPKGTLLKSDLKSDSDIRYITWNIAGKDEAYQEADTSIGTTNIVTAPFDIYFSRHYVTVSGSQFIHFAIETVKYLNKEEEEEDFNKNQFKIQFTNTVSNGVAVTVVGKNKIRLNGTATAGFNLNFAFRTIDLSIVKKTKFFIQSTTTEGFYVQTGYFESDDTPHNMAQMIQPMTWTEVDFPSDAYTGRLYVHVNAETTFSDETISFYCYYVTDSDEEDTFDATLIFNGEPYTGQYDWQTPVVSYGKLFKGKSKVESFAFFTDPHVLGFADDNRNETSMENYFKRLQKTYNSTPCSFMVCGGDWLNNSTTMDEACYRLGYLRGIATNMLDGCHLVMGNHDTNYQGKYDADSEISTGRLTDDTIRSIMYRETPTQKAYYSFDGANSKCYILDTGIEHGTMLEYDWEQIDWLARQLKQDDHEHNIIFLHILYNTQGSTPVLGNLAEAYNSHTSITLNGTTYDFGNCTGKIELFIAGHTHTDSNGVLGGVPYFITATRGYSSDEPIIDLVLIDYVGRTVNLVRVGTLGSNRMLQLA